MKFMIEFNPPVDFKNELEMRPDLQKKIGEAIGRIRPISGWFTWRYGFIIVEANTTDELNRKVAPILHLFKTDAKVSPAIPIEELGNIMSVLGEEAKKYE